MSLWFIGAQAQETVRGVVTDAAGEPLIGANVVEKGQPSNGTITNLDGKFTLKVTSNKAIIAISMIGMKTVEVTVPKDGKTLTVRLHDDTQTLDEVVVVAYGQQIYFCCGQSGTETRSYFQCHKQSDRTYSRTGNTSNQRTSR